MLTRYEFIKVFKVDLYIDKAFFMNDSCPLLQYILKQLYDEDVIDEPGKRAWNSGFTGGVGKRAWNSGFNGGVGKRAWNSGFTGGVGKRAWNSGFAGGVGKRAWNSGFTGGVGKRAWNSGFSGGVGKYLNFAYFISSLTILK